MRLSAQSALDLPLCGAKCPFLYQTRTILATHHPQRTSTTRTQRISTSRVGRANKSASEDVDNNVPEYRSFLQEKAAQVGKQRQLNRGPSMTQREQEAFNNLFDLFKKPVSPPSEQRPTSVDPADTDYKNILDLFASLPSPTKSTLSAVKEAEAAHDEPPSNQTQATPNPASSHIPTQPLPPKRKLRKASATEVQGLLTDTASAEPSTQYTDEIRSAAHNIVQDVADNLTTALHSTTLRPDIAMWQVAEQQIFPLIRQLHLPKSRSKPKPKSTTTSALSAPDPPTNNPNRVSSPPQTHPLIPPTIPLLPLLTLAYPSLTLLLIRLYLTHHATSPYALAVLPTLRSLGPTSYILGANTHFYNALLSLQWTIYSSLRDIAGLLSEMRANGVDFDLGTWHVLEKIDRDRMEDQYGFGERGVDWWARHEQRVWWRKVGEEWREVVRLRLQVKGVEMGVAVPEASAEDAGRDTALMM